MTRKLDRRMFLGGAGLAAGASTAAHAKSPKTGASRRGARAASGLRQSLAELVNQTPFIDTHEHLWPESLRIQGKTETNELPAPDLGMLLNHYTDSDLRVCGLSQEDFDKIRARGISSREKWRLVAPYYERCRHTGYQRCIRESIQALYGEEDLREDNCERIAEKLHEQIQPGFYRRILRDVANIECAHVNALEGPVFRDNEPDPELLAQDLWIIGLGSGVNLGALEHCAGGSVRSLDEAHAAIDAAFAKYGPRAIAVKDQSAYARPLDYADMSAKEAAPLFENFALDNQLVTPLERKALQNHLFRYCVNKATEYNLPVKLHTGYFAGQGGMELRWVKNNLSDLCSLFRDFPETRFVLMHMSYPYQDELIAVTKHYPQVYADMCWGWIINPAAAVRFLKEFIMAAPASKIFTFGGDYLPVELVPGHARIARQGIVQALSELIEEGWMGESDAPALIERLMRGNARETFDHKRALNNWR